MNYDLIIVGAGPGGFTAAIYAKRANLNVCIIEQGAPGGQIVNSYMVENYPGYEKISGVDLAMSMYNQVVALEIPIIFESVTSIEEGFVVKTTDNTYNAKRVIVATGQKPKSLGVPNEASLMGKGISFCAICDGAFYKNKDVIVVGGGNAAIEESIYLASICKSVTVLVRNKIRADKASVDALNKLTNVKVILECSIIEFINDNGFKGAKTNKGDILANGCFLYVGNEPQTKFLDSSVLDKAGYVITNEKMETSISGLYAIGDCRVKELRQIVTATSDGAIAAMGVTKALGE